MAEQPAQESPSTLSLRASLALATLFWIYVSVAGVTRWAMLKAAIPRTPTFSWDINAVAYTLMLPVVLLCVCVSHRVGYELSRWPRIVLTTLLLAIVLGLCGRPMLAMGWSIMDGVPFADAFDRLNGADFPHALLLWGTTTIEDGVNYVVLQAILMAAAFYVRLRHEQDQRQRLAGLYDRARLQALRMQTNPHFLFNTLSAIAGLVRERPEAAEAMITRLGDLLRSTLSDRDADFVPLHRELDLGDQYLAIQAERFDARLRYVVEADAAAQSVAIPPLLLQPLLENAVEHGLTTQDGPMLIEVKCTVETDRVQVAVRNRISQLVEASSRNGFGFGLENVRARLQAAFGDSAELAVGKTPTGHFEARMTFPARLTQPAADRHTA